MPRVRRLYTHQNFAITMAMDFVSYVDGTTSVLCHGDFPFLSRLELPDGVLVLWVLLQLFSCHGPHSNEKQMLVLMQA